MPHDQRIFIADPLFSTWIIIAVLLVCLLLSIRRCTTTEIFSPGVSQELKGFGMLTVLFGHIGYFLVNDWHFLKPLSVMSGVGVDVFLFLSGYGLTIGMMKKSMPALQFYQRRMIKVFLPFWVALIGFFILDAIVLERTYPVSYILRSIFGLFPVADMATDVNSVFWYITWILMYYLLFPLVFMRERPWLSALILFVIGQSVVFLKPEWFKLVIRLYEVHTLAFPLGVLVAWLLYRKNGNNTALRDTLREWRINLNPVLYAGLLVGLAAIFSWFAINSGVNKGPWIEQSINLIILFCAIGFFTLKEFTFRFFDFFGKYSYEIYLLHWPLLSRYDYFFEHLPAWLAMFAYLVFFVGLAWLMQKITEPPGSFFDQQKIVND
jgi:peptidoglycan/LPS O-acetylase OafA/YrhL